MSKRRQIGPIERFTNKMTPLFRGLIGAGVDDPHAIAVELNRRGLRGLNGGRWKTRTVVAAIGRGAPELAGRVRRAQLRYPMANLELAWRATRQRANPFDLHILPAIRELLAAGVVHPHAIARELNRRGLCGPKGGKWKKEAVIRTVTRAPPNSPKTCQPSVTDADRVMLTQLEGTSNSVAGLFRNGRTPMRPRCCQSCAD